MNNIVCWCMRKTVTQAACGERRSGHRPTGPLSKNVGKERKRPWRLSAQGETPFAPSLRPPLCNP